MTDLEAVTDDEEEEKCGMCLLKAVRKCHLCEKGFCVRHWGPSDTAQFWA